MSNRYNKRWANKKRFDRKRKERGYMGHSEETTRFHRLKTINPVKNVPPTILMTVGEYREKLRKTTEGIE